ncbi:MAG: Ig-like domain-containing protein [Planctomycetia bacterium]|nr:Ig-like domain-containing protein [Planctomycetia bacterium]
MTITVNALNDAPTANDGSLTTNEDIATTGMLSASDIDSPTLTFSLGSVANAHGLVTITDPATGAFSYTPETNYNGSASFTFSASDGSLVSNIGTVTITVNAVNDAPTANDGSLTTIEETATTGTLSATDIDSAALTFSLGSTTNAHGIVTITDATTGAFSYAPDANFDGSASFTFSASDGSLVSNFGTVTITVNGVNDAPIASDSSLTTDEDTAKTGTLSAADIDSATLAFNLVSTSNTHGSVTITNNTTGAFSYMPDANFSGSASFTFLANDGSLVSNIGTVTMTVNALNDAPVTNDGSLTSNEDTVATGTLSATDIDSAALTFSLVSTTNARGTVTITDATTGAFSYTPDANFNGLANFTFSASDGSLVSSIGTVTITVNGVNDAPTASDGSLTTNEDTATTGTLLASDIDSAALSFSLVSTTNAQGSVTITNTATGAFSYTPDEDFSGSASFTFLASDGTLDSNIGTVTITVNAVSDIVVASDGSLTTNEDTATTGTLVASDLDGSVLAYSLFSATNAHGSVTITNNTTGAFSYTPDANFSGSASFTFLANDSSVVSNIATVTITVNAVNDAPSFTKGVDQSGSLSGVAQTVSQWVTGISAGPADEAEQLVNFLVSTNNGALFSVLPAISADGTLTYTLVNNPTGPATVSVRLHDNGGIADGGVDTSVPQTFVISTVNRAPSFVKGANQSVLEDAGTKTIVGWATSISAGLNELAQVVDFFVTTNNNGLFSELPAISATGTLTYTTAPNANGSAIVTVRAHDNGGTTNGGVDSSAPQTFTITVQAVNDLPTISAIADITTDEDTSTGAIAVTIADVETTANSLVLSAVSSNTSLIPNANILFGGSGANRTITLNPAANQFGTATITLSVRDGNRAISSETFIVTVNAVNDAPTVSNVANQTIDEDKSTSVINFTIGDVDNLAGSLVVAATSSNLDLVPLNNIVLGGSGSNRTIKVTPLPNQFGATTITLTATDPSGASSSDTFLLTVRSVNDPPAVAPATFSVSENTTNGTLVGTVSATDLDLGDTVTAFAITAGNLGSAFAIDNTGKITVKDAAKIDFEAKPFYTLTVKATDNHGASGFGTVTVTVGDITFNPIVTLGNTANSVVVSRVGSTLVVRSGAVNLTAPVRLEDVGVLTIIGGAAADSVTLDSSLNASGGVTTNRFTGSVVFQGNGGDDVLDAHNVNAAIKVNFSGGAGNDIAMGGAGNDTLSGDDGRDWLVGGAGNDLVNGGSGEDIIIGGTSTLSGNSAALNAVMIEWTDFTKNYVDRIQHLSSGGVGSANGSTRLNSSTVKNDSNAADSLNGNADLDWFFQSANDVLDAIVGEIRTMI